MPFDVALQIIEDTDRYELSLTDREYLMHLRFFYAYMRYGELVPSASLKDKAMAIFNEYYAEIGRNGYAIVNLKESRHSKLWIALCALSVGVIVGILLAHHFKI